MILGLVEHDRGTVTEASCEMLTLGRRLAQTQGVPLQAVVIGGDGPSLADRLATYGVSTAHLVVHDQLGEYAPAAWAQGVVAVMHAGAAHAVLAAGSDRGNEVLAHVGAKVGLPMAANCIEIEPGGLGEPYRVTRLRWGGSLHEVARLSGSPKLLTVAPHTVAAEPAPTVGEVVLREITPTLSAQDLRVRVTGHAQAPSGGISLTEARVVVTGGRGVGSAEGFRTIEELARVLRGAVGCSRAVTSLGWRPHTDQVGQTGTRVAPEIYIACGVSGAIQHMVGCKGAKHILAVNTDPEAPIMTAAHYAVIGDLHEVIPAVVKEIRHRTGA